MEALHAKEEAMEEKVPDRKAIAIVGVETETDRKAMEAFHAKKESERAFWDALDDVTERVTEEREAKPFPIVDL